MVDGERFRWLVPRGAPESAQVVRVQGVARGGRQLVWTRRDVRSTWQLGITPHLVAAVIRHGRAAGWDP
ncbi:MAG: hypothetical protein R3F65_33530, partial [bacterium]